MGNRNSAYVAYGVQVGLSQEQRWEWAEVRPQDERVVTFMAGEYDNNDYFLVVAGKWKEVEPGELTCIPPYQGSDEPYLSWDAALVAAAEEMKVPITSQPGWLFMPDEA